MSNVKILESMLSNKMGLVEIFNSGASLSEITRFECKIGCKLPKEVVDLYLVANGQQKSLPVIEGYWFASLDEAFYQWAIIKKSVDAGEFSEVLINTTGPVKAKYYSNYWIPILISDNQNLSVDLDPEPGGGGGQVVEVVYDDEVRVVVAKGVEELFKRLIGMINDGDLKYDLAYEYFSSSEEGSIRSLFNL